MRAIRARYDPYLQTRGRVDQLKGLGHSVDKVEFIVMGGAFHVPARNKSHCRAAAGLTRALYLSREHRLQGRSCRSMRGTETFSSGRSMTR